MRRPGHRPGGENIPARISAGSIDRRALLAGSTWGPLATLLALLALLIGRAPLTNATLLAATLAPTGMCVAAAVASALVGRRSTRWVWAAIGALSSTVLAIAAILGVISAAAWMLSDPG